MTDLTTGKSVLVLATVIGCFAILWPRIFYPMMQTTFSLASPLASQDDANNQNLKPDRVRGHPPVHAGSGPGGRIPPRIREIVGDGRPDIDPLTTITMEDGRPFTRPGVRGPATRPQQKPGGTMSIVMPVYTIGIVGFFLYTILKLVFKNKQENEEDQETDPRGYSSTMKKLGVDPAKLSKLKECVYNSGRVGCQDMDDYSDLISKNRMKTKDTGRRKCRSDLGKPQNNVKPTKKSPFQGLKKHEGKKDQSEEEAVYQNLREAEEKVKLLQREVERQRRELANNKHHQFSTKMQDVKEEIEQKLDNLKPEESVSNANDEDGLRCSEKTLDQDDSEETDYVEEEESAAEMSDDDQLDNKSAENSEEDEWEDRNSECEDADETVLEESPDNEEDKILQILDLLIREKVQNGGPETEVTKTILRLRKELDQRSLNAPTKNDDKKRR